MRPLRALTLYLAVVFLGAALLAPALYALAQSLAGAFPRLAQVPFHRFVHRSLLLLALLGIWPLLKSLGATSWRQVGFVKPTGHWPKIAAGFAIGFLSFGTVAAAALVAGARVFSPHLLEFHLLGRLLAVTFSAAAVAILEELLFRGTTFGALRRAMPWGMALLVSSMLYAIVHFLQSARLEGPVTWHSGLEILPRMLKGFADWQQIIPGFFNLTLAGVLLAYAYQKTGNLWLSIGLHAGWIFWMKCYYMLTRGTPGANIWFWGTSHLIDGWCALIVVAIAFPFLKRSVGESQQALAAAAAEGISPK